LTEVDLGYAWIEREKELAYRAFFRLHYRPGARLHWDTQSDDIADIVHIGSDPDIYTKDKCRHCWLSKAGLKGCREAGIIFVFERCHEIGHFEDRVLKISPQMFFISLALSLPKFGSSLSPFKGPQICLWNCFCLEYASTDLTRT